MNLAVKQRGGLHNVWGQNWEMSLRRKKIGKRVGDWGDHSRSDPCRRGRIGRICRRVLETRWSEQVEISRGEGATRRVKDNYYPWSRGRPEVR